MKTAEIIHLTSSRREPVLQTRKAGRLPKCIGNLQKHRQKSEAVRREISVIEHEIQALLSHLETHETLRLMISKKLGELRNPRMTAAQRSELVMEIEWVNMPYQELEERKALREHLSQYDAESH